VLNVKSATVKYMHILHGEIVRVPKAKKTRTVKINRTYTLTSINSPGMDEELDIIEKYLTRTCLDEVAIRQFAKIFNANISIEIHNE